MERTTARKLLLLYCQTSVLLENIFLLLLLLLLHYGAIVWRSAMERTLDDRTSDSSTRILLSLDY